MDLSIFAPDLDGMHDISVLRFTKVPQPSGYVEDTYAWQSAGILQCGSYPVKDVRSIELYGPRISKMRRLHFAPGTVIAEGDGIAFDTSATAPTYAVIGARSRGTHTLADIEVIGIGN